MILTVKREDWEREILGRTIVGFSEQNDERLMVVRLDNGKELGVCGKWLAFGIQVAGRG